jgi:hypothetical protein
MVARGIGGANIKLEGVMRPRSYIWLWIFIGSTIGGLIPQLWDAGMFSYSSWLLSGVGAFLGLWIGAR